MALDPVLTTSFGNTPNPFPPSVNGTLIAAIVGGNPFAESLTRYDSGTTSAVFGVISEVAGAAWINEGDAKPDLSVDATSVVAVAQELAGIAMISDRAVRDARVDLLGEVQRVLRTYFGKTLDDGLLHGSGVAPQPRGVLDFATEADGANLWAAVHTAKAEIVTAGGNPSTIALSPADAITEEARLNGNNEPMYPAGLSSYAGLDVVRVPALDAGEVLVYDRTGCYLVVAEDFRITPSRDYAPAYQVKSRGVVYEVDPPVGRVG